MLISSRRECPVDLICTAESIQPQRHKDHGDFETEGSHRRLRGTETGSHEARLQQLPQRQADKVTALIDSVLGRPEHTWYLQQAAAKQESAKQ
jgi:hypothetical protein